MSKGIYAVEYKIDGRPKREMFGDESSAIVRWRWASSKDHVKPITDVALIADPHEGPFKPMMDAEKLGKTMFTLEELDLLLIRCQSLRGGVAEGSAVDQALLALARRADCLLSLLVRQFYAPGYSNPLPGD